MKQTDTRKCHGNIILITRFNHMIVAYRTSRLCNITYTTFVCTLNIVTKREEGI